MKKLIVMLAALFILVGCSSSKEVKNVESYKNMSTYVEEIAKNEKTILITSEETVKEKPQLSKIIVNEKGDVYKSDTKETFARKEGVTYRLKDNKFVEEDIKIDESLIIKEGVDNFLSIIKAIESGKFEVSSETETKDKYLFSAPAINTDLGPFDNAEIEIFKNDRRVVDYLEAFEYDVTYTLLLGVKTPVDIITN